MRRSNKIYASGLLVVCIVVIVGCLVPWGDRNVTVYDDKFKILECSISKGTTHTFYHGSQAIGRMRDKLGNQFGLKFLRPSSSASVGIRPGGLVFFVRYEGDFPYEELDSLAAVLTNGKDIHEQMSGRGSYDKIKRTFTRCFMTHGKLRASDDPLRIDFYLNSEYDEPIATWTIGESKELNKGLKAAF